MLASDSNILGQEKSGPAQTNEVYHKYFLVNVNTASTGFCLIYDWSK